MRNEGGWALTLQEGRDFKFSCKGGGETAREEVGENPQVVRDAASPPRIFKRGLSAALSQGGSSVRGFVQLSPAPAVQSRGIFGPFSVLLGSSTPQPRSASSKEALRDPGGGSSCAQKPQWEAEWRTLRAQQVLNPGRDRSGCLTIQQKEEKPMDDP